MINRLQKNIKLAPYTTFQIGGPADFFVIAKTKNDLIKWLEWAKVKKLPATIIGGGSNVLVSDSGIRGLVILNKSSDYRLKQNNLIAESGAILSKLSRESIKMGLSGLDFGANIPGTIGGAVVGNAGAYGKMIGNSLISATCWDIDKGIVEYKRADFDFRYRCSKIKNNPKIIIIEAKFQLRPGNKLKMLHRLRQDIQKRRDDFCGLNCGCYFKNPENVEIKFNNKLVQNPSAGLLIDLACLKSYSVGQAKVSESHANVIVNQGGAKARDIFEIEQNIIKKINDQFGILLVPEVTKIGKF